MKKNWPLNTRVSIRLMIAIPLLMVILVFGTQLLSLYVVKASFVKLIDDQDVFVFQKVLELLQSHMVTAVIGTFCIGLGLAYAITFPLRRLVTSADQVATGDLTKTVRISSEDEIGALGRSFNTMVSSLNEHIIESMTGGVITIDMKGQVVTFNKSAELILGYDSQQVVGKPVVDLFPEESMNTDFTKIIHATLREKRTSSSREITIVSRTGRKIPIGITTSLLRDKNNTFLGIVVTFKDLEHIKHLEEQMRRADRLAAVGSLAAGIAHEIRNPLGSVKGLVQLLKEDLPAQDKKHTYAEVIVKEVDRLNKVVEELLSFARPDKSELEAQFSRLNIQEVLEQTVQLAGHDAKNAVVKVERDFQTVPQILGDAKKLQQAFLNIIFNAFAAMSGSGTLTVATRLVSDRSQVEATIRDTGCGIPAEKLGNIFDPFYTTREGGTGLGLTITHQIISSHGGKIDVRSDLGKGTQFVVTFPVAAPEADNA